MNKEKTLVVDNIQSLEALISSVKEAQRIFSTYSQEQVDKTTHTVILRHVVS